MATMGPRGDDAWLETAEKWARNADTRTRVFDDPSFVSRAIDTVKNNACSTPGPTATASVSAAEDSHPRTSTGSTSHQRPPAPSGESRGDHEYPQEPQQQTQPSTQVPSTDQDQELHQDPAFHAPPPQVSPEAAGTLRRVFTVLRNSSAGCPANNHALRHTGLAEAALQFAVDQAPFACPGSTYSHPISGDNTSRNGGGSSCVRVGGGGSGGGDANSAAACKDTVSAADSDAASVRLAVRAGLQFACNYCVGSEANKTLLWDAWFPRGLMELANGLKTDRGLLALAIALIFNCCLPSTTPPACEGSAKAVEEARERQEGRAAKGRERLGRLVADRAFCCLLMKVVVVQNPSTSGSSTAATATATTSSSDRDPDPAAEWLYLLFCTFVQERLCGDVYANVGIRAGGRSQQQRRRLLRRRRHSGPVSVNSIAGGEAAEVAGEGGGEASGVGGSASVSFGVESEGPGGEGDEGEEMEKEVVDEEEEDFLFPVTPEQLIVLNLAEMAAGDETVTGGERPDSRQRQACDALAAWLADLLSAMPFSQTLLPPPPQRASTTPTTTTAKAAAGETEANGGSDRDEAVDPETENVRRSMREEARSAVLRALSALLAGCCDDTRRRAAAAAAAVGTASKPSSTAAAGAPAPAPAPGPRNPEEGVGARDPAGTPPLPVVVVDVLPERRLVPLCLRLLRGCGTAARPEAKVVDGNDASCSGESPAAVAAARGAGVSTHKKSGEGLAGGARVGAAVCSPGVPAGRKVELLKVIGNACFRCPSAQDLVREEGGLPVVLSHCGVDEANTLLREYALLAVRNLCEGNAANQGAIAALQPQGCAPGAKEALADMGLQGSIDARGKFSIGPSLAATPGKPSG